MSQIVSDCKKFVLKTKLQAESIVMHCSKGSMSVISMKFSRNFKQHRRKMSTSDLQYCNNSCFKSKLSHLCTVYQAKMHLDLLVSLHQGYNSANQVSHLKQCFGLLFCCINEENIPFSVL